MTGPLCVYHLPWLFLSFQVRLQARHIRKQAESSLSQLYRNKQIKS